MKLIGLTGVREGALVEAYDAYTYALRFYIVI